MTSYYLALGFFITIFASVNFLVWVHTSKKNRQREAQQLSNIQKEIERNRETSQATINKILQYSKNHVPTNIKGKYETMHMN